MKYKIYNEVTKERPDGEITMSMTVTEFLLLYHLAVNTQEDALNFAKEFNCMKEYRGIRRTLNKIGDGVESFYNP